MPRKSDLSDLTCCLANNPVLDIDNVYFSDQGWAYRHYKSDAKSNAQNGYWDEILVAGQALLDNGQADTSAEPFGTPGAKTFLGAPAGGDGDQGPAAPTGPIESLTALETTTAFTADEAAAAVSITGGASGTVETDADGEVVAVAITAGGADYEPGDSVTITEDGAAGEATARVAEIG